jgi:UTP--glucose-1-phosphate uridylyltransferase
MGWSLSKRAFAKLRKVIVVCRTIGYNLAMTIRTAVIASAGFGTRFLPITKSIQKEMLPILARPTIDYVVADCIKAGIENIIFVINEHNIQIKHFYSNNPRLKAYLEQMQKADRYEEVAHLHTQAKFSFIKQPDAEQYGTAVPVKLAEAQLKNEEAFLVFMGDDFIFNADGSSEAARMITTFTNSGAAALATCITRPEETLHKYGIAEVRRENGFEFLTRLVEKPKPGTAPSNLANISKYIFTPQVFETIRTQQLDAKSGELYITDSLQALSHSHNVVIHKPSGEYLDSGSVVSWLHANLEVARHDPELRAMIVEFAKTLR